MNIKMGLGDIGENIDNESTQWKLRESSTIVYGTLNLRECGAQSEKGISTI